MAKNTTGKPGESHRAARLRQQAEEFLRTTPRDIEAMSVDAIHVLVHEFQVYQVELEMQNEELRRVQHDLEESRQQYKDLFDFAPVGYLSMDHNGRIEQANLTAARLLGVDRARLPGALLACFVVSEDRDVLHQHRQAVKDTGSHVCELRLQAQPGIRHDVRLETRAVPAGTKDTLVYRTVLLVITERKQAEERFRRLLEATPDAMIILDSQDGISLVNAQMEQLFGYTRQELLGQPIEMLLPRRLRRKHITLRARYFTNPVPRPMGTGLELLGLRKDGTEFPIEVSLSPLETEVGLLVSAAIHDISARRQLEGALQKSHDELEIQVEQRTADLRETNVTLQDEIAVRKQTETALLEAEQFARSIVDALSAHIAILDEQGTILSVNKAWRDFAAVNAAVPERSAEGVNYLAVCEVTNGKDAQAAAAFAEGIQSVLHGKQKEFSLEYACHSTQERRWFIGRVTRFLTDTSIRIVVAHEDITPRRQAQEKLQTLNRELEQRVHERTAELQREFPSETSDREPFKYWKFKNFSAVSVAAF